MTEQSNSSSSSEANDNAQPSPDIHRKNGLLHFRKEMLSDPVSGALGIEDNSIPLGPDADEDLIKGVIDDGTTLGWHRSRAVKLEEEITELEEKKETVRELDSRIAAEEQELNHLLERMEQKQSRLAALTEAISPGSGTTGSYLEKERERLIEEPKNSVRPSSGASIGDTTPKENAAGGGDEDTDQETSSAPKAAGNSPGTPSTSLLYGLLYSLVGIAFIGGDLVMSRELVASAYRLEGTLSTWIFSGALASLAILLKPVYTRIVESEYWLGNRRPFVIASSVTACAAIVTLSVLGLYRYETHVGRMELRSLQQQVETASPEELSQIQSRIQEIQQSTAESTFGLISFVLTTVVFAIAGAVALGIGARHLRGFYHWRLLPLLRRYRLSDRIQEVEDEVTESRNQVAGQKKTLARLREKRSHLPDIESLDQEIESLEEKRREELEGIEHIEDVLLTGIYKIYSKAHPESISATNGSV